MVLQLFDSWSYARNVASLHKIRNVGDESETRNTTPVMVHDTRMILNRIVYPSSPCVKPLREPPSTSPLFFLLSSCITPQSFTAYRLDKLTFSTLILHPFEQRWPHCCHSFILVTIRYTVYNQRRRLPKIHSSFGQETQDHVTCVTTAQYCLPGPCSSLFP